MRVAMNPEIRVRLIVRQDHDEVWADRIRCEHRAGEQSEKKRPEAAEGSQPEFRDALGEGGGHIVGKVEHHVRLRFTPAVRPGAERET
jgi:hypothetical protein